MNLTTLTRATAVTAVLALAACSASTGADAPAAAPQPFAAALTTCATADGEPGVEVADGGRTLLLDGKGKEDYNGATITTLACVLSALSTPQAVISRMDSTRALDGQQQADWTGYHASWTYHPDAGLDLILEAK